MMVKLLLISLALTLSSCTNESLTGANEKSSDYALSELNISAYNLKLINFEKYSGDKNAPIGKIEFAVPEETAINSSPSGIAVDYNYHYGDSSLTGFEFKLADIPGPTPPPSPDLVRDYQCRDWSKFSIVEKRVSNKLPIDKIITECSGETLYILHIENTELFIRPNYRMSDDQLKMAEAIIYGVRMRE